MTNAPGLDSTNPLARFFGVVARGRTYLNALYLLAAFPLGVFYFCFLVIGLSLGFGLLLLWIGLVVLALVLLLAWMFSAFERLQAIWMLGARLEPLDALEPFDQGVEASFGRRAKRILQDRFTWTGPLFLFLKFPLGIFSFVTLVTLTATSGALLAAPFLYRFDNVHFHLGFGSWHVDTLPEALGCSVIGLFLAVISLHAFNGLAWVWRQLAELLLGQSAAEPMAPEEPTAPPAPDASAPPTDAAPEPA